MTWLAVPDFADALGLEATHIRDLLRQGERVAGRRGENNALYLPQEFIVSDDHSTHVRPTLAGTITLLSDAGLSDAEIVEWLTEVNDELETTPLEALRSGKRAPVRRAAQTLG